MIDTLLIMVSVPVGWCLGRLTWPRWWWVASFAWLLLGAGMGIGQPWAGLLLVAATGAGWWSRGRHTLVAPLGESVLHHPGGLQGKWRALRQGVWVWRSWPQLMRGAGLLHAGQQPILIHLAVVRDGYLISAWRCDGQTTRDWLDRSDALAAALGVERVTISRDPVDMQIVHVRAATQSPLEVVTVASMVMAHSDGLAVEVGQTETGDPLVLDVRRGHMLLVGGTGSGKSTIAYRLAAAWSADPCTRVIAVDPSQLVGAPFAEAGSGSCGDDGPQGYVDALADAVEEMDRRLATLRGARTDDYADLVDRDHPWLVVVIDEAPGLVTSLETADRLAAHKPAERWATQAQAHVRRLLLEGRKAGVRVVISQQRADIDGGLLSGAARDQAATQAVVLRSQPEGVRMLLPGVADAAPDYTTRLPAAPPGVCLAQVPGHPLSWARTYATPDDEDYRWWHGHVTDRLRRNPHYAASAHEADATPTPDQAEHHDPATHREEI